VPAIIPSSELNILHPHIGSGAFGKVYKGKVYGMDVAIKVLEGIEWDESVKSDFIAEVNVMVQLVNPHIVLCMGACIEEEDGDNHYAIILEYMHRGNLHNLIHDKKSSYAVKSTVTMCGRYM
jgi:serine/threonine protein kinase